MKFGTNNIVSDLGTLKKESTKKSIYGFTYSELLSQMKALGLAEYRTKQVFDGIYKARVSSFSEITTLDKNTKELLDNNFSFINFDTIKKQTSKDGSIKYLFKLHDEKLIEAVYMPWLDDDNSLERATLCISSQVGCAVDCSFCATGKLGFKRNLDTSEIISQIIFIENDLNSKINNVVFMGMGEPLLNYKNVVNSINIMTDLNSGLINRKKITLSTSGIVPKIYQLSSIERPVKLAISLHATTNGVRDKIVPLNTKANIESIMDAVEDYYRKTKMAITYEYIPFLDLNDTELDAKRLAKLTKRVPSRVNLIPFNDISFTNPTGIAKDLKPTPLTLVHKFAARIRHYGGFAVVRDTFGDDIDAACGQLALSEKQNTNSKQL